MTNSIMLFGSAARGDGTNESDVDILVVTESGKPFSLKQNAIELQFLPKSDLIAMAVDGDLFAIHLAFEGIPITDPNLFFPKFKESLVIRNNYAPIRKNASDLGWFLLENGANFFNISLVNKRIAWCVRTILISKLVESGKIIYSPAAIIQQFPFKNVRALMELRRSNEFEKGTKIHFRTFLSKYGNDRPLARNIDEYNLHFKKTENKVAISTCLALTKKSLISSGVYT